MRVTPTGRRRNPQEEEINPQEEKVNPHEEKVNPQEEKNEPAGREMNFGSRITTFLKIPRIWTIWLLKIDQ